MNRPVQPFYDSEFLTVNEVAGMLRVSKMSVYRLIKLGELKGTHRFGRTIRVPRECLMEFLRGAHHPAASPPGDLA